MRTDEGEETPICLVVEGCSKIAYETSYQYWAHSLLRNLCFNLDARKLILIVYKAFCPCTLLDTISINIV
jgi:hypothetical protein